MALNNFFKINFPYGIMVNKKGEWTAFNREYKPLGCKDSLKAIKNEDFIYCKYKGLTDTILKKLADTPGAIEKDNNKIIKVFLYNDATNPSNQNKKSLYKDYFAKLELLSKLKVQ